MHWWKLFKWKTKEWLAWALIMHFMIWWLLMSATGTKDSSAASFTENRAISTHRRHRHGSTTRPLGNSTIVPSYLEAANENGEWAMKDYDWNLSTEDNYRVLNGELQGRYVKIRKELDYSYHSVYSGKRQLFQDRIIASILALDNRPKVEGSSIPTTTTTLSTAGSGCSCAKSSTLQPLWIVFTAGAMGAGKSHTVRLLHTKGRFPLHSFVVVDPDNLREKLPEYKGYIERCTDCSGEMTGMESGMIAEILTIAALKEGRNVLVDGTLRDAEWYEKYMHYLRRKYANLCIGILQITAERNVIFERAWRRGVATGRIVPRHILEESLDQVPKSVTRLRPLVDFHVEINNGDSMDDVEIVTDGVDWDVFQKQWTNC